MRNLAKICGRKGVFDSCDEIGSRLACLGHAQLGWRSRNRHGNWGILSHKNKYLFGFTSGSTYHDLLLSWYCLSCLVSVEGSCE